MTMETTERRGVRGLQGDQGSSCFVNDVAFYPFNFNNDVEAYEGLMFSIENKAAFAELLTLEFDVLFEADTDYSIEVYAVDGDYADVVNQPEAWSLLASSTLALFPDSSRGAIVPAYDFKPLTLGQNERKSLYLKMKGPWIDHTNRNSAQDGQPLSNDYDKVDIFPGAGLTGPFPSSYDTLALPIFAGGLHIRAIGTCVAATETTVSYIVVTDSLVTDELLVSIAESVDATMSRQLRVDSFLVQYQNENELEQVGQSVSGEILFSDTCRWQRCTSIETTVTWTHSDDLDVNAFLHRMYTFTAIVTAEIRALVGEESRLQYAGKEATKVEFRLILKDVKLGSKMDPSQQDFFARHTLDFINSESSSKSIEALALYVDEMEFVEGDSDGDGTAEGDGTEDGSDGSVRYLESRELQEELGQLELRGRITGTRYSYVTEVEFAEQIQGYYENAGRVSDYVKEMVFDVNFPGPLNEFDRHEFFADLTTVEGFVEIDFDADLQPSQSPTSAPTIEEEGGLAGLINNSIDAVGDWDVRTWIILAVSILATFIVITVFLVIRCLREQMESKKRKEERQVDKQFMHQEKRIESIRQRKRMQEYEGSQAGLDYSGDWDDGSYMGQSYADNSFMSQSYADDSFMDQSYADTSFMDQSYADQSFGPDTVLPQTGSRRKFYGPALARVGREPEEQSRRPESGRIQGGAPDRAPDQRPRAGGRRASGGGRRN